MNDILRSFILIPTILSFILLAVYIYKCRKEFDSLFKEAGRGVLFMIAAIFCLSLFLRATLVTPKHLLYNDEFYHMITAKNILLHANLGIYYKSLGWSSIIAVMFAVFGINNFVAIGTSIFFGALTIINVFLLIYLVFKNRSIALLSAFVFGVMPYHIFWSATAETNVVSIFFVTFSIAAMLLYFQNPARDLLWLSLLAISFASQIRPENYVFFAIFIAGFKIFMKRLPDFKEDPWLVAALLALPNLAHVFRYHQQVIVSPSRGLFTNMTNLFPRLFDASLYPFLFIVLFCAGFFYLWFRKVRSQVFFFLIFMALCLIYFYGWYDITSEPSPMWAKTRFYICLYPVLIIWFAAGAWFILRHIKNAVRQKIALLVILGAFFWSDLPYFKTLKFEENFLLPQILETAMFEKAETELAPGCLVVTACPEALESTTRIKTIDVDAFILNPDILSSNACVLFLEDYYCMMVRKDRCDRMKGAFRLEPVKSYESARMPAAARYTFHRVVGKKEHQKPQK